VLAVLSMWATATATVSWVYVWVSIYVGYGDHYSGLPILYSELGVGVCVRVGECAFNGLDGRPVYVGYCDHYSELEV